MRRMAVLLAAPVAAAALLALGGCAIHHVNHPDGSRESYYDWESDPGSWGGHFEHDQGYDQ